MAFRFFVGEMKHLDLVIFSIPSKQFSNKKSLINVELNDRMYMFILPGYRVVIEHDISQINQALWGYH
jgi:hypothetical protein